MKSSGPSLIRYIALGGNPLEFKAYFGPSPRYHSFKVVTVRQLVRDPFWKFIGIVSADKSIFIQTDQGKYGVPILLWTFGPKTPFPIPFYQSNYFLPYGVFFLKGAPKAHIFGIGHFFPMFISAISHIVIGPCPATYKPVQGWVLMNVF